ncbi:MAG: beta-glucosidase, partial [Bacteroidota bacterium]|nr:beta-glucosidase [Bacteroidota bacterium]
MKKIMLPVLFLLLNVAAFSQGDIHSRAKALLSKMTLEEKIGQLNLLIPGGAAVTGSVVSTDVENKIRKGQVGGLFGFYSP